MSEIDGYEHDPLLQEAVNKAIDIDILEQEVSRLKQALAEKDAQIKSLERKIPTDPDVYLICEHCNIKALWKQGQQKLEDLQRAIRDAGLDRPHDEVHCSCVPLLKMRLRELEDGIRKHKKDWFDVMKKSIEIENELWKLIEDGSEPK